MNNNTEELASLYVLDELTPKDRREFEKRLESEPKLLALVRELESALEDRIRSLPQKQAPHDMFARIKKRIEAEPATQASSPVITMRWSTFAGLGMAAALLLGVGLTLLFTSKDGSNLASPQHPVVLIVGMESNSSSLEVVPASLPADELENFMKLAGMAESYWTHPEQLPGKMNVSPLANTLGSGYAVYDPRSKHGFIAIQNLPEREEGKNYFLWLRDVGSKVLECAGSIPLDENNQGLYFFELDDNSSISSNRVAFFITEEPEAVEQPSKP
ncbi:MAG: hypothetical protein KJT03_18715, partial [Verrucomicrobiae bacterium]|nr:hypothetical protein [Verrucomicrobiae bacterium]